VAKNHKKVLDPMSPEICMASAIARLTATPATTYAYAAVENGKTCFAATAQPTATMTSMTGVKACTVACYNTPGETCGGKNMVNLYASVTSGAIQPIITIKA
jgi:iron transport multicopper oxidase